MSPITPIATYLLYLTLSIPNSHFCTHKDRIAPTTTENKPVCALYSGDCASVSGFCQKTFLNAQAACHDNNVLIYTTGECNQASVQACPASKSDSQEVVCSFSVQRRLGGVSEEALKSSVSAHEACKSDSTAFFVKSDCSAAGNTGNICTKDKRAEASKCTASTEAISCVYYAGGDCQAELCRKTQKTDCSLCQDMSVLFFTEGACEDSAKTIELERSLYVVQPEVSNGFTVPHDDSGVEETEANIEEQNGSLDLTVDDAGVEPEVAPEDDPNGLDLSNDVPDVEAETLADGTVMLTPVVSQDDPNGLDLSVDDAGVEPEVAPEDDPNGLDLSNDVPEVEAKTLEDGTIELTPVAPQDDVNGLDLTHDDSGVEETEANDNDQNNGYDLSNDAPEVEAKTLEDGTIELTPVEPKIAPEDDPNGWDLSNDDANDEPEVAPEDDPNGWDLSNDDAVVEAETLVDGPVEAYPINIKNSGLAPEDDPNGWDLSNDDASDEPEVAPEDDPNGWDLSNDDANDEPEVAPEDDPNGWNLSNDDAGVEPEVQTENTQPETEKKPKPSSPYNTHNFKFNAIPLENSNESFKAELSNGMTVASFQEPSEEN